jgi:hypothetical protein
MIATRNTPLNIGMNHYNGIVQGFRNTPFKMISYSDYQAIP